MFYKIIARDNSVVAEKKIQGDATFLIMKKKAIRKKKNCQKEKCLFKKQNKKKNLFSAKSKSCDPIRKVMWFTKHAKACRE